MSVDAVTKALGLGLPSLGFDTPALDLLRIGNNYVYADTANQLAIRVSIAPAEALALLAFNEKLVQLAQAGAPIVAPSQVEPIELATGHLATLWPLGRPPEPDPAVSLAPTLSTLHQVDHRVSLPTSSGFGRARRRLAAARDLGVPASMIDELGERLDKLGTQFPTWAATRLVHGDAHTGNIVRLDGRHLLVDLDDLALGCPEIDLAPARISYRRFNVMAGDWPSFLAAYGSPVDLDLVDWFGRLRQLTMMSWLFTLWNERQESRSEIYHRMATLDTEDTWHPL